MTIVMEDSMQAFIRTASLGAALLAGTAAAHAQYVIAPDAEYVAPAYVAPPAVAYAPGPAYVVAAPTYAAPTYVAPGPRVIVTQPAPVAEEIVTQPARRTIVTTQQQPIMAHAQETVRETAVERTAPRIIHRSARTTRVHLTSRQRRDVLRTIRYERTATPIARERIVTRTATAPAMTYSVGSVLPGTVPTYAMPREVVYEAPALQGYAYAPVGNRVLVVEPASSTVVADLE
jgi:Protein of unknown function (DUF1236)